MTALDAFDSPTALPPQEQTAGRQAAWYNTVWRWHFYAGLFCVPFVIWLAITGTVYVWRSQIETLLDRPYDHLSVEGTPASADAQVNAALAAVHGSTFHRYILQNRPDHAVRILVTKSFEDWRVIVDPHSLAVLNVAQEEARPMRLIFHLHGELLAGAIGSYLVEMAACWAVIMLLTGLFLWWPRGAAGLAGTVYPRFNSGSRVLWRDLHATVGFWVSIFALGLILTGLPWAKGWGSYLTEIRELTGAKRGPVDWSIGGSAPKDDVLVGDHHHYHDGAPAYALASGELTRVIAAVEPLNIAPPVMISPPSKAGQPWRAASDAADRPLRSEVRIDGQTGTVLTKTSFAQRHWIDRAIGYGIAVHEGVYFGLANQILSTVTALLLMVLAVSGVVMWWRRRPANGLGAPIAQGRVQFGVAIACLVVLLGLYMPMFGLSLILLILLEFILLRRIAFLSKWLGLRAQPL